MVFLKNEEKRRLRKLTIKTTLEIENILELS